MTLNSDIKYGTVIIDSDPRGATIYVDGQILINQETEESIKTPAKVSLIEGKRDIVLRADKHDDYVTTVSIIPGTTVEKFVKLVPYTGKQITPLPLDYEPSEFAAKSEYERIVEKYADKYGRINHRHFGFNDEV